MLLDLMMRSLIYLPIGILSIDRGACVLNANNPFTIVDFVGVTRSLSCASEAGVVTLGEPRRLSELCRILALYVSILATSVPSLVDALLVTWQSGEGHVRLPSSGLQVPWLMYRRRPTTSAVGGAARGRVAL